MHWLCFHTTNPKITSITRRIQIIPAFLVNLSAKLLNHENYMYDVPPDYSNTGQNPSLNPTVTNWLFHGDFPTMSNATCGGQVVRAECKINSLTAHQRSLNLTMSYL